MDSLSAEEILWTYRSMSQHISCKTASRLIQIINQRIISCHCFKYPVKYLLRHPSFYRNRDNVFSIHYPFIKASIYYLLVFIQLIVAINKSDIFNWKNVRRLRWLGVALLLNFISEAVPALMNDYELSSVFSLSGYSMETSIDSVMLVILGLVSLIVGEVFAIGLKMKEEQDLTI